jgi:hypothetical protein
MKRLLNTTHGFTKQLDLFFDSETSNQEIFDWVEHNIVMGNKLFGLNSEFDCKAELNENVITISGDDDLMELSILPVIIQSTAIIYQ